ncbi:hypothetical protein [Sphingobacterium sp.]|uniref:hypothetical protein n=1 Tax=Sphingobacterium sp. TaxID=341027 RepID=UPI0028A9215A|nr:hypothetical protein [Sphingobacterium sp.]
MSKGIETQTGKIPSVVFLGAALLYIGVSAVLKCLRWKGDKYVLIIGQWAAPSLLLGICTKRKTEGHD